LIPSFSGEDYRVRCFNHIVNLVAKCILRPFEKAIAREDGDDDHEAGVIGNGSLYLEEDEEDEAEEENK
jgi:hypothetical protein